MCTVVAIAGPDSLSVAANRDEFYARPSAGPRRLEEHPRVVAGLDLEQGGSWMGANEVGIFAALTNQRQHEGADPARASRGHVVLDALARRDVSQIDAWLGGLDGRAYNGFNLLYGAVGALRVAYARPDREAIEIEALGEGLWVLPNDRIGSPEFPKAARARALVAPVAGGDWETQRERFVTTLADHEVPPLEEVAPPPRGSVFPHELLRALQAICIHTPTYGTRSATLLALSRGRVERYLYADGPPCEAPFEDVTELLR